MSVVKGSSITYTPSVVPNTSVTPFTSVAWPSDIVNPYPLVMQDATLWLDFSDNSTMIIAGANVTQITDKRSIPTPGQYTLVAPVAGGQLRSADATRMNQQCIEMTGAQGFAFNFPTASIQLQTAVVSPALGGITAFFTLRQPIVGVGVLKSTCSFMSGGIEAAASGIAHTVNGSSPVYVATGDSPNRVQWADAVVADAPVVSSWILQTELVNDNFFINNISSNPNDGISDFDPGELITINRLGLQAGLFPAAGFVGEVAIFNRLLTADEYLSVYNYLSVKWVP